MKAADLGVLNHFSLGVGSAADAFTLLWNEDRLVGAGQYSEDRS